MTEDTGGDVIKFGRYSQGKNGEIEDIEWIVLDVRTERALILSKYALDAQPYNETPENVTWETCTLRKWLNETFFKNAFSEVERDRIIPTVLQDSNRQLPGINKECPVTDRVFLLDRDDAINSDYGFSSKPNSKDAFRRCQPTEYALPRCYVKKQNSSKKYFCGWWLRSPILKFDDETYYAASVHIIGSVRSAGDYACSYGIGVRPAIWIRLNG